MAASAFRELVGQLGLLWIKHRPFSRASRERRKAKRAVRKKVRRGEPVTVEEMYLMANDEPTLRTSTKSGGTMGAGTAIIALIGVFFPEAMDAMSPETAAILASAITAGIGWLVARVSKTATKPGLL